MGKDIQGKKTLIYLPVAHLSPVCAYRVEKVLKQAEFDTLFVELPKEARSLLPALTDRRTVLPVSLLFRSEDCEAVLPLTEYSPEYVAVKTATELGKQIVFIDSAAYFEAPVRSEEAANAIENVTGGVFDDDRFFDTMDALAERFAHDITEREAHMLYEIESSEYERGIVVAGAAHCKNLKNGGGTFEGFRGFGGDSYIIPYIPRDCSVVRYGYNRALYKRLGGSNSPFSDAALDILIKQAEKVKTDYTFEHIPVTDMINTLVHMRKLAELRGKRIAGFTELIESANSVIGKGEDPSVKQHALMSVVENIPNGELAAGYATPLAEDFKRCLKDHSIKGESGSRVTLQILENPAHREKSAFLRRIRLLIDDGFAELESGADYANGKDLNKVREVWRTHSVAHAVTKLTYVSHLGATVEEATQNRIDEMLDGAELSDAPQLAAVYMQAYLLRLDARAAFDKLSESIFHISDFEAAVSALCDLVYLIEVKRTFEGERASRDISVACSLYGKALELLSAVWMEEKGERNALALARLNNVARAAEYLDKELLAVTLAHAPSYAEPCLAGCVCAVHDKGGVLRRLESYSLSAASATDVAMFILGLAIGDRGLLADRRIIETIAGFVERLTREEFMDASPSLRYAFSFLKLTERNRVREITGELYGEGEQLFLADDELLLGDEYLARQIELYGLDGVRK